ncbi:unnamed protein product [Meganyctiphanes norvegica]|uniref:Uncharacterized protein n=1 Tax=Meganyctiphanes norvegica TaxID=48144 RepID=A0AAV2RVD5_MEGNR
MESVLQIASGIVEPLWGCTLDLQDAYFHVPMAWFFHRYLAFVVDGITCLPVSPLWPLSSSLGIPSGYQACESSPSSTINEGSLLFGRFPFPQLFQGGSLGPHYTHLGHVRQTSHQGQLQEVVPRAISNSRIPGGYSSTGFYDTLHPSLQSFGHHNSLRSVNDQFLLLSPTSGEFGRSPQLCLFLPPTGPSSTTPSYFMDEFSHFPSHSRSSCSFGSDIQVPPQSLVECGFSQFLSSHVHPHSYTPANERRISLGMERGFTSPQGSWGLAKTLFGSVFQLAGTDGNLPFHTALPSNSSRRGSFNYVRQHHGGGLSFTPGDTPVSLQK